MVHQLASMAQKPNVILYSTKCITLTLGHRVHSTPSFHRQQSNGISLEFAYDFTHLLESPAGPKTSDASYPSLHTDDGIRER